MCNIENLIYSSKAIKRFVSVRPNWSQSVQYSTCVHNLYSGIDSQISIPSQLLLTLSKGAHVLVDSEWFPVLSGVPGVHYNISSFLL